VKRTHGTVGSEEGWKLVFLHSRQTISLRWTDKSVGLLMIHFPGI
jgi:hypothetical protein